jgi:Fe-S cluster assembly protein SufD
MMTQVKEKNQFRTAFDLLPDSGPLWLKQLRKRSIEQVEESGFPTTDDEDWKYTNVQPLLQKIYTPQFIYDIKDTVSGVEELFIEEARENQLVFINGRLSREHSNAKGLEGLLISDLIDAIQTHETVIRENLASSSANSFAALNTALFTSGAFVYIKAGVVMDTPIHLLFITDSQGDPLLNNPRVLVVAGRDSRATVIESYVNVSDSVYLTNSVAEFVLDEGARIEHYKLQQESLLSYHIASTSVDMERYSSYDSTTITLGAMLSRHDIGIKLDHEASECWIDGLYMVRANQHADTHSLIDHISPHCRSHQLYKGILSQKSRGVFNGKVFVHKGAQQTDAFQTNKNLLLSADARVDTKPQLEIYADDVKCAHGATVGQLNNEELFYLESRGLNTESARSLLTYGFAEEVVEKIKVSSLKARVDNFILNQLDTKL